MGFQEINIDEEKALRKLSVRERVGIRILLAVFLMVYPCRYPHQVKKLFDGLEL